MYCTRGQIFEVAEAPLCVAAADDEKLCDFHPEFQSSSTLCNFKNYSRNFRLLVRCKDGCPGGELVEAQVRGHNLGCRRRLQEHG